MKLMHMALVLCFVPNILCYGALAGSARTRSTTISHLRLLVARLVPKPVLRSVLKMKVTRDRLHRIVRTNLDEIVPKFQWPNNQMPTFKVKVSYVDSASINPFSGTITMNNEEVKLPKKQLQFLLAHEIAHKQQYLEGQLSYQGLAFFDMDVMGRYAALKKSQKVELDADARAAKALGDAAGGITFFNGIMRESSQKQQDRNFFSKILEKMRVSTHPAHSERVKALEKINSDHC